MLFSTFILLSTLFTVNALTLEKSAADSLKYLQKPHGDASFTVYTGCGTPGNDSHHCSHLGRPVTELFLTIACGKSASGFTAAMNQLAFGAPPGLGAGDACGRCFLLTGTADPYSPAYTGPFYSIVAKVTDLW